LFGASVNAAAGDAHRVLGTLVGHVCNRVCLLLKVDLLLVDIILSPWSSTLFTPTGFAVNNSLPFFVFPECGGRGHAAVAYPGPLPVDAEMYFRPRATRAAKWYSKGTE
jgi:hypothetical protein